MKSNYKKLGPYIREVVVKNTDLKIKKLLGVSITKRFIPSIANTIGTDMSKYKIVRTEQFAYGPVTSRNGDKISVAPLDEDDCIISTSYTVFEITDTESLDPEYLMMWFRRPEFDRYARYMSHGSVREIFGWEEMCDVQLPIPNIDKQREIVREYNVIVDRIKLNEQLNQKLEETAQAIYKQWFVDFEFPISKEYAESIGKPELEGKPYKSSGGEMVWNDECISEIPLNWIPGVWGNLATQFSGYSFKGDEYSLEDGITVVRGENVTEQNLRWDTHKMWNTELPSRANDCFLKEFDIVIGMDGSKVGKNWALISKYQLPLLLAQRVACVRANDSNWQSFLYYSMFAGSFASYVSQVHTGTSVPHISGDQIMNFPIIIPDVAVVNKFNDLALSIVNKTHLNNEQILQLKIKINILLSKLAVGNNDKVMTIVG